MPFSAALRATSLPRPRVLCRSNPAPRRTLPRTTRVAPAFLFCGFAARSFSSSFCAGAPLVSRQNKLTPRCSMLDPRYDSYRTRPYRLVPRMTRARACLAFVFCGFAARSFFSRLRPAARTLPRPRCSPSHSGQPLSPVSMCSMGNPRSDSYCVRSYVYHACHAFAPAFVFCGFAARSFSSCLRFAARTLPRPCRSPPPSWQPLSPIPVCCVDPILRCAEPYPVRHASRLPFCFAGSRRGAFLRRFVPVLLLHPVRISLPRNARCSMLDPRYGSYRT